LKAVNLILFIHQHNEMHKVKIQRKVVGLTLYIL